MSHWDSGRPADGQYDAPQPSWPDGTSYPYPLPFPLSQALDAEDELWLADGLRPPGERGHPGEGRPPGDSRYGDERAAPYPPAGERVQPDVTLTQPVAAPPPESSHPWPPAPYPASLRGAAPGTGEGTGSGNGREHGSRRWPVLAGIVAGAGAVGAAAVLLTGSHSSTKGTGDLAAPSSKPTMAATMRAAASPTTSASPSHRASPSPSPSRAPSAAEAAPLTVTQAQAVLASYTTANNSANAQRSDTLLATVETASSYAIDAGMYQAQTAAGAAPFPAFSPVQATYYIPQDEPATGARWFVVQVANAFTSDPKKVTSTEYLLFTQPSPGSAWQNAVEPYLLTGATAPQIEVGADGLATAVSPGAAALTVAPGQLAATTAASLDGTGQTVADPGNLADKANQQLWQGEVAGGTVTDTHAAADGADGQEFALLTTGGGALVFYTDTAQVTITPPAGSALHLTIPGLYSPSQGVSQAAVGYLEQFAAYDPPAGSGAPRVVADYSGITGKD
jgi:hypothetical protein